MTRRTRHPSYSSFASIAAVTSALLMSVSPGDVAAQPADDAPAATADTVERKGFVIGFGIGAARVTTSAGQGPLSVSLTETAVSTDFKIGYAPTDQLLIYWSADGAFRSTSDLTNQDGLSFSGLGGIGATYFLEPGQNSFFVSASIGRSSDAALGSDGQTDALSGSGFAIGGGYEFSGHWTVDADIVMNSLNDDGFGGDYSQRIIRVGLSWLHY